MNKMFSVMLRYGFLLPILESVRGSSTVDTGLTPDVIAYPYEVHMISCDLPTTLDPNATSIVASRYSCRYFCSASLTSSYLARLGTGCVTEESATLADFVASSEFLPTVRVLATTTAVDESIRFKLTGATRIFVADCVGQPCLSVTNLVVFAEVLVSNVYGVGSQSHACTTCAARQPIPQISLAGRSGAFVLFNGLSWTASDQVIPPTTDYTRPQGLITNLVSFDRTVLAGYTDTLEAADGFTTSRPPSVFNSYMDNICRTSATTSGLTASTYSEPQYLGRPQCADPVNGLGISGTCFRDNYLPFTGANNNQFLSIARAGTIALCACGVLSPTLTCLHPMYRFFAGLVTVAGPVGNQTWSVPVHTVFGLTVQGFGLGIKAAGRDFIRIISPGAKCTDSSNQPSSITGFKIGCPDCSGLASANTSLAATAHRSADNATIPKIRRIKFYAGFARLFFASSVSGLLASGDRIAIALDTITIDGKIRAQWEAVDAVRAFHFTGRGRYADTWNTTCSSSDCDDLVTGHIVTVEPGGSSVTIPAGFDEFESITITPTVGGADWERHSHLTVGAGLKGTSIVDSAPVCWGRLSSNGQSVLYYSQAGAISFYQPSAMTASSLSFMTGMPGVEQTVVLGWTPNFRKNLIYTSLSATSTVILKLTFLNLTKLDVPSTSSINEQIDFPDKSVCGKIFNEFSTNHADGFPQPAGCSVGAVFTDTGRREREIRIYFASGNPNFLRGICALASGTRVACNYQLSFNGVLGTSVGTTDQLVRLEMTAPSATDPYYTFESSTALSGIASQPAGVVSPHFNLYSVNSSSLRAEVEFTQATTTPVSIVRLFLSPSLQWNMTAATNCSGEDSRGDAVTCAIETFANLRSVVKLTLASPVSSGNVGFIIGFTANSWGIPAGFISFDHYLQLRANESLALAFVKSEYPFGMVARNLSAVGTAQLVSYGPTGDGLKPFLRETGDSVVVRYKIGKTLIGSDCGLRLRLPEGYWCIPPETALGWTSGASANECLYTLSVGEILVGGAWQSVTVQVANPPFALARTGINNKWSLAVEVAGWASDTISEFTGQSRAVISSLTYAAIQPSSLSTVEEQELTVFASTAVELQKQSGIVIIAPEGFSFNRTVCAKYLHHLHYMAREVWRPFPLRSGDLTCDSQPYLANQTSLVVRTTRIIPASSLIAFKVVVSGTVSARGDWQVFTVDPTGEPLQGSQNPVEYGGRFGDVVPRAGSWKLYLASGGDNITISPAFLSPGDMVMAITGIISPSNVRLGSLTIQVPDSFVLNASGIGISSLPFTCEAITQVAGNKVLFVNVTLVEGANYTVSDIPVTVPVSQPEWTAYSAFIEIGPDIAGSVVAFPPIRAVADLLVHFANRVASAVNTVSLRFRTVTALAVGCNITVGIDPSFARNVVTLFQSFSGQSPLQLVRWLGSSLVFSVQSMELPAGAYELKLNVTNPATLGAVFDWSVSTSLDASSVEQGPSITRALTSAVILADTAGRDNRLGRSNTIVFQFEIPATVSGESVLTISGPPGFVFSDKCSADVNATVRDCRGSTYDIPDVRSWARITLEGTLQGGVGHNLTVVVRNPVARGDETLNYWLLDVNDEFSVGPIASIELDDFSHFSVSLASTVIASNVSRPITFYFSPKQSLPVTNTGRLKFRTDIRGTVDGELNTTMNSGVKILMPEGFSWDTGSKQWNELKDIQTRETFSVYKNELYVNRTSERDILLILTGNKTLISGRNYTFISNVFVNNSAAVGDEFMITSLQVPDLAPADESSFALTDHYAAPVGSFVVSNLDANYQPGALVRASAEVTGIVAGATIVEITPPGGFNGSLSLSVVSGRANATFSVLNPSIMSSNVTETYWRMFVKNAQGIIVQTGAVLSWRVVSVISSPLPQLSISPGGRRGAGASTSLLLTVSPVTDANFIYLSITNPAGFDFSKASVDTSGGAGIVQSLTSSCWFCIGIGNVDMRVGHSTTIQIDSVQLGSIGADVTFTVQTFFIHPDETITNPLTIQSAARDQAVGVKGFFMSGALSFAKSMISSSFEADNPDFVAEALNPRTNIESLVTLANVTFTLSVQSLPTATGRLDQPIDTKIVIKIPTLNYRFSDLIGLFEVSPPIGSESMNITMDYVQGLFIVEMKSLASQLRLLTTGAYNITVPVIPIRGGVTSAWGVDLYINGTLLNTNDGSSIVPSEASSIPVESIQNGAVTLTVVSSLVAPNTFVDAEIVLRGSHLPERTNRVRIIAPWNFKFVSASVGVSGVSVSVDGNILTAQQSDLMTGSNYTVSLRMITPLLESQAAASWAALAYSSSGMTGWSEIEALNVSPMPMVEILYGGTSTVTKAALVVCFTVRESNYVSSLEIFPPAGVGISCVSETAVAFINCTTPSTVRAGLTLNRTTGSLNAGRYTLPLLIDLPVATPTVNQFDIIARNRQGVNVDGVYAFTGNAIVDSTYLSVINPIVNLSSQIAGSSATLNLTFTLTVSTRSVDAIHLQFPAGYYHRITDSVREVRSVNRKFPRKSAKEWLYTNSTDSITFLVDDTRANIVDPETGRIVDLNRIPGNETYSFTFPVVIATETPELDNFFLLSFCESRNALASCTNSTNPTAWSRYPIFAESVVQL